MDKFQDFYRIKSIRLQNWDYGWNATYFVTICMANGECCLGEIANCEMIFSEIGKYAYDCWLNIPKHYPFVKLDEFIIMPNHVHGIIVIDKQNNEQTNKTTYDPNYEPTNEPTNEPTDKPKVETQNFASLQPQQSQRSISKMPIVTQSKNKFGPQSQNLASIVRGFKSGVTIYARKNHDVFAWQPRFYEHIIRDHASYQRIRKYILDNPKNWKNDELNNIHEL